MRFLMNWRTTISDLNQVIFANIDNKDPWSIDSYISSGGYEAWRNILNDQTNPYNAETVIEMIKKSGLTSSSIFSNNLHSCSRIDNFSSDENL